MLFETEKKLWGYLGLAIPGLTSRQVPSTEIFRTPFRSRGPVGPAGR